jgi:hypothetical protein
MASCNYKKPFLFSAIQSSISAVGMYRIVLGLLLLIRIKNNSNENKITSSFKSVRIKK